MAATGERTWASALHTAIFGDPLDLATRPVAYEALHNEVQNVLIPPTYPKGINVHMLQSINQGFALQHR